MKDVLGKDGVKYTDSYGDIWVAWDSNQIKNIDNLQPTKNDDIRYSIKKDSEGNALTEGQAEFFKDSKAVDDKGNLIKVYHGGSGRNVYDGRGEGFAFARNAVYLTESKEVADAFAKGGVVQSLCQRKEAFGIRCKRCIVYGNSDH